MNNRRRRVARLKAKEDARILEWGALQALKRAHGFGAEVRTLEEAIKIVSEKFSEALAVNNDWLEDE